IDKRALREVAEKATPGNWRRTSSLFNGITVTPFSLCGEEVTLAHTVEKRDAEFIAAANPATVLALLDELEHYKSREERVTKLVMDNSTSWDALYKKLEAAEKRNAELQSENAYIRNRYKELDLLIGKNILVMQAAIIEWQATGDAKSGLAWIYNTLFGPGELPDESEKDAQAYFNRKCALIDEKLMELHKWFWEQSEAESAAGIRIKGE
ncbi:ead/Ea22-like family protein, partial [Salmonella enterica subsp. salamae]|nr:ead/Ea22-like family protein [Salmonella enterica subsp. salamae]